MVRATSRQLKNASPVVGRRAVQADVVELDLADIEHVEFLDHGTTCYCGRMPKVFSNLFW
jgi:hypothetical protein